MEGKGEKIVAALDPVCPSRAGTDQYGMSRHVATGHYVITQQLVFE
jgi:hypothetical protein